VYDPAADTWTMAASMSDARDAPTATLLSGGRVLVAGGVTSSGVFLSSTEEYDPLSNTWTAVASLNQGRDFHTATLLPDGRVLVAGGLTMISFAVRPISATEVYVP